MSEETNCPECKSTGIHETGAEVGPGAFISKFYRCDECDNEWEVSGDRPKNEIPKTYGSAQGVYVKVSVYRPGRDLPIGTYQSEVCATVDEAMKQIGFCRESAPTTSKSEMRRLAHSAPEKLVEQYYELRKLYDELVKERGQIAPTSADERLLKYKRALDLALYYIDGESTYEILNAKIDGILIDEPTWKEPLSDRILDNRESLPLTAADENRKFSHSEIHAALVTVAKRFTKHGDMESDLNISAQEVWNAVCEHLDKVESPQFISDEEQLLRKCLRDIYVHIEETRETTPNAQTINDLIYDTFCVLDTGSSESIRDAAQGLTLTLGDESKKSAKDRLLDSIMKLDGFAAVNLAEPSSGDLERVYKAYSETFKENKELKARVERLEMELLDCRTQKNNAERFYLELQAQQKELEKENADINARVKQMESEKEEKRLLDLCAEFSEKNRALSPKPPKGE